MGRAVALGEKTGIRRYEGDWMGGLGVRGGILNQRYERCKNKGGGRVRSLR